MTWTIIVTVSASVLLIAAFVADLRTMQTEHEAKQPPMELAEFRSALKRLDDFTETEIWKLYGVYRNRGRVKV